VSALWQSENRPAARPVFSEAYRELHGAPPRPLRGIRRGSFTLHEDLAEGRTELFDLRADPHEQVDIAPDRPADVAELLVELHRFHANEREAEPMESIPPADLQLLRRLGYIE